MKEKSRCLTNLCPGQIQSLNHPQMRAEKIKEQVVVKKGCLKKSYCNVGFLTPFFA